MLQLFSRTCEMCVVGPDHRDVPVRHVQDLGAEIDVAGQIPETDANSRLVSVRNTLLLFQISLFYIFIFYSMISVYFFLSCNIPILGILNKA